MAWSLRGLWDAIMRRKTVAPGAAWSERAARQREYAKYLWCYRGVIFRGGDNYTYVTSQQMKRLVFNFAVPICNTSAAWLAGPEVRFVVTTPPAESETPEQREARIDMDRRLSAKLDEIWDRSGSNAEFMDAALSCAIYGDIAITVRVEGGKARLAYHEPGICDPEFSPHDARMLESLVIAYPIKNSDGEVVSYVEEWGPSQVAVTIGESAPDITPLPWAGGEVPAMWVRNESVKGREFGASDIETVYQALVEYDHLAGKQTRIIDYYSAPSIVVKGGLGDNVQIDKDVRTVYEVGESGDVSFLEWRGTSPGVEKHLETIRRAISEMAETPEVAFGKVDQGFTHASGVSMKVLYGPLENKTKRKRAQWGPALERAMWLAIKAEGVELPLTSINIVWGECAPHSESEALADLEVKTRLGLSSRQALREMLYTEDQVESITGEKRKEMEDAARLRADTSSSAPRIDG